MFWGCVSGELGLGPGLFWEKTWGTITQKSYVEHTVPEILLWIRRHPELQLMQNNASSHAAKWTREVLGKLGISPLFWLAFSPDLNPIEVLWDIIKNSISYNYIMEDLKNYDVLRKALNEAWAAIGKNQLNYLIDSMPARCEAVIAANSRLTKY